MKELTAGLSGTTVILTNQNRADVVTLCCEVQSTCSYPFLFSLWIYKGIDCLSALSGLLCFFLMDRILQQ